MGLMRGMFSIMGGVTRAAYTSSLYTSNSIYTALQNARTRKEIRNIYQNASEANYVNRCVMAVPGISKQQLLLENNNPEEHDVYDLQNSSKTPAQDYIWGSSNTLEGLIVSGGDESTRVQALIPFIHKAQQESVAVMVLHTGNNDLEAVIPSHSVDYEFVSRKDTYLDIFRGMPVDDIAYLLYELMSDDGATPAAESFLRALIEVVLCKKGNVTINDLAKFPMVNLKAEIDKLASCGDITNDEYTEINRYYMAGSSELDSVRVFLNKLNRQTDSIYGMPSGNCSNIKKMINCNGVEAINVGQVNNELVVKLVVNYLLFLQTQGKRFAVVIDGLQISKHSIIVELLRSTTYSISNQDFVASIKGGKTNGDELFSEILGNVSTVVMLKHSSGDSRKKWSDFMGTYKKIRYNSSQSNSFINSNNSRGISVDEADEPRIRPETLEKLFGTMACIYNAEGILIAQL